MKDKVMDNVMNGFYSEHPQGRDLLDFDITELAMTHETDELLSLRTNMADARTRIMYLEHREKELMDESAIMRTELIENGKENPTNSRNLNTKDK